MVDASTGQIIYEQNANQQLPVASISKLLTVAVIHDELKHQDITDYTKVQVTPDVAAISNDLSYSSVGLVAGQSYPVIELLNAAMVKSADGATAALATANGNSLDEFVLNMEKKAKEIGLRRTKIVNPTGLTNSQMKGLRSSNVPDNAENEMSAKDVALLARYLIHSYPQLLQVTAQKKTNIFIQKGNTKSVENLNKMLPGKQYTVPGVTINGLKTGTSDKAGACFVSTGKYRGHQIITVVLHANGDNDDSRFVQTQKLYRMLKTDYHLRSVSLPKEIKQVPIDKGNEKTVATLPSSIQIWEHGHQRLSSYTVSENLYDHLVDRKTRLRAPIKQDQRIGSVRLTSGQLKTVSGEPLNYPIYSKSTVNRGNFFTRLLQ